MNVLTRIESVGIEEQALKYVRQMGQLAEPKQRRPENGFRPRKARNARKQPTADDSRVFNKISSSRLGCGRQYGKT